MTEGATAKLQKTTSVSGFGRLFALIVQRTIQRAEELGDGEAEGVGEFFDVVDGNVTCKDALMPRAQDAQERRWICPACRPRMAQCRGCRMHRSGAIWLQ